MWRFQVSGSSPGTGTRVIKQSLSSHVKTEVFTCSYLLYWVTQTFPTSLILPLPLLFPLLLLLPSAKKNKSPSQLRRQEGLSKQKEDSDKLVSKNVFEAEIEKTAVKPAETSADESVPQFKCKRCLHTNITEKGLAQHIRMKHKISQVDGNIDSEEEVLTFVVEDNKSERFDPSCFHMLGITEECAISCNKKFSS